MTSKLCLGLSLGIVFALLFPAQGQAKKREPDHVTVSGFYSQYLNAGAQSSSNPHPAPSADMELAVRTYSILSLVAAVSNSIEPDANDSETTQERIRTAGGGIKLDFPGFFLIGAEKKDFRKWTKSSPLNTFLLAEALSVETRDLKSSQAEYALAGRFGAGFDVFPFTELSHFTFRCLYLNFANQGFVVYSFGGGITF